MENLLLTLNRDILSKIIHINNFLQNSKNINKDSVIEFNCGSIDKFLDKKQIRLSLKQKQINNKKIKEKVGNIFKDSSLILI